MIVFDRWGYPGGRRERDDRGPGAGWVEPNSPHNRDRHEAPYAYSPYFIWKCADYEKQHAVYSDRLEQWDRVAFERAHKAAPGRFENIGRDGCSKFLTAYYGKPIDALALAEGCNVSNGYPYWIFWFRRESENEASRQEGESQ